MNVGFSIPPFIIFVIGGLVLYYIWFYSYSKTINKHNSIKNIMNTSANLKNINIFENEKESVQILIEKKLAVSEPPKKNNWENILEDIQEQSSYVQNNNKLEQYLEDNDIDIP